MAMRYSLQRILISIAALGFLISAQESIAEPEFLSAPVGTLNVREGYQYNVGGLHRGIDYRAATGTVIRAAADGWAIASYNPADYGLGQFVLIRHDNGYSTLYAHLSNVSVTKSFPYSNRHFPSVSSYVWQQVFKGQIIGYAGSTGTKNAHLHYEVALNPSGTWSGHYNGKLDPYDIKKVSAFYPPEGSRFTACGANQNWIPSVQTCPPSSEPVLETVEMTLAGTVTFVNAFGGGVAPGGIAAGEPVAISLKYDLNRARLVGNSAEESATYFVEGFPTTRYKVTIRGLEWVTNSYIALIVQDGIFLSHLGRASDSFIVGERNQTHASFPGSIGFGANEEDTMGLYMRDWDGDAGLVGSTDLPRRSGDIDISSVTIDNSNPSYLYSGEINSRGGNDFGGPYWSISFELDMSTLTITATN